MSTPMQAQSRLPNPLTLVPEATEIGPMLSKVTGNGAVPQVTRDLMGLRAGQIVGNTYLILRLTDELRKAGETEERICAVASWRDAPYFTDAERVALALLEAVLTANPRGERVPDELYARVSAHYDEKAIATLVMAIGQIGYFIPLALIGKPLPGVSPEELWRK